LHPDFIFSILGYPKKCLFPGGRGGARPGVCERGGYLPILRRDSRAGSGVSKTYLAISGNI